MSFSPPQNRPGFEEKSHTGRNVMLGCLGGGCLLIVIGVIVAGVFVYSTIQDFKNLIEDEPRVAHYEPTPAEVEALKKKADKVTRAQEKGDVIELVLTAEDINTFIAQQVEEDSGGDKETAPRIRFEITGSVVSGSVSLPNKDPNTGKMSYFNGEADFTVAVKDGKLEVYIKDVRAHGEKLPAILNAMVESMKQENMAKDINTKPEHRDLQDKLKHCKKLEVKDGKVYVTIDFPDTKEPAEIKKDSKTGR